MANLNTISIREIIENDFKDIYMLNKDLGYEYDEQKLKKRIQYITKNTKDVIFVGNKTMRLLGTFMEAHMSFYMLIL